MIEQHPGHTHRLPRALLLTLVIICAGLVVSIFLVSTLAVRAGKQAEETDRRLTALEGFIQERGEQRDQEYSTLDERITNAICDVLEGLPAGGLLDGVRSQHGCGPGVPLAELSPEAQDQLQQFASGIEVPPDPSPMVKPRQAPQDGAGTPTPSPTAPTSAAPSRASTAPATPPPGLPPVTPEPSPSAPPLVDLNPITEPLCNALGICL